MTALTDTTANGRQQGGSGAMPSKLTAKMEALASFKNGSLICINTSTGYDVVGSMSPLLIVRGVYLGKSVSNSGSSGEKEVDVYPGLWRFDNYGDISIAHRGQKAYIVDDNTVSFDSTGKSQAGVIDDVDAAGVWVRIEAP